jgi:hypothetical protein
MTNPLVRIRPSFIQDRTRPLPSPRIRLRGASAGVSKLSSKRDPGSVGPRLLPSSPRLAWLLARRGLALGDGQDRSSWDRAGLDRPRQRDLEGSRLPYSRSLHRDVRIFGKLGCLPEDGRTRIGGAALRLAGSFGLDDSKQPPCLLADRTNVGTVKALTALLHEGLRLRLRASASVEEDHIVASAACI